MARKRAEKKKTGVLLAENLLPQNIALIGERVEENKNIYISQKVYREIHKFAQKKTVNESGGVLVGRLIHAFDKVNIVIEGFVEAQGCTATPTTLTFTHETWNYWHKTIEKKYPKQKIVGWLHTHPDFGIFLSGHDKFIQENFFREDYEVAYVVDPIQKTEGFFFWMNGSIERCKGFYLFDKPGVKLTEVLREGENGDGEKAHVRGGLFRNILLALLALCVVLQFLSLYSLNRELEELKRTSQLNAQNIYNGFATTEGVLNELYGRILALEQQAQEQPETSTESTESIASNDPTVSTEESTTQTESANEATSEEEAG